MGKPKQVTHNGLTMSVTEWAERLGINRVTLTARLGRYGMTPEKALTSDSLALVASGNHYPVVSVGGGKAKREHIILAERALGRPLPDGAEVHHVDEDITNNAPGNLVICPDHAYHRLLHMRSEAHAACGHYDWRKCCYCKQWDSPDALVINKQNRAHHRLCHNKHHQERRERLSTRVPDQPRADNKTGITGITKNKTGYCVKKHIDKQYHYIGQFKTFEEANAALERFKEQRA